MSKLDVFAARRLAECRRALAQKEMAWGTQSSKIVSEILNLADLCCALEYYCEAEQLYMRYLTITCKKHGHEHPTVAHALRLVGEVRELQGLYDEAEHHYLWALSIRQKTHPADRESTDLLTRLLWLYRSTNESFKERVIERRLHACVTGKAAVAL